jgi:hypothetical protein
MIWLRARSRLTAVPFSSHPAISDLFAQCRASYVSSRFGVILGTAIVADAWSRSHLVSQYITALEQPCSMPWS